MTKKSNRIRLRELICILITSPALVFCQQTSKTTAPCSPIAPNNTGIFKIQCPGISDKLGHQLIDILNRIREKQLDPDVVMAKLDELLSDTKNIKQGVAEIKQKQEGRRLSELQKEFLKGEIPKPFETAGQPLITCMMGNSESTALAMDFVDVFRRAGWTVPSSDFAQVMYTLLPPRGVIIKIHSREDADLSSIKRFEEALFYVGLERHGEIDPNVPSGEFRIMIGAQP
jgi:hypothetical protein